MKQTNKNDRYQDNNIYEVVYLNNEALLIPKNSQSTDLNVLILNEMSCHIWQCLIIERLTVSQCIDILMDEYEVDYNVLSQDIEKTVLSLVSHKAIIQCQ